MGAWLPLRGVGLPAGGA